MDWIYLAADLVLITVLVLGLYRSRHGRKDLVISYMGANVGVLVVAAALSSVSTSASLGVGLGLFGVLSIIRLRSTELEQYDVAYFFSSLAMGLIAGLSVGTWWLTIVLMSLPIVVLAFVDHPRFMATTRHQRITLDHAVTMEPVLVAQLQEMLGATVTQARVVQTDLVQDKTIVDVTYRLEEVPKGRGSHRFRSTEEEYTLIDAVEPVTAEATLSGQYEWPPTSEVER